MAVDAKELGARLREEATEPWACAWSRRYGVLLAEAVELWTCAHANMICGSCRRCDWLRRVAEAHAEGGDDE